MYMYTEVAALLGKPPLCLALKLYIGPTPEAQSSRNILKTLSLQLSVEVVAQAPTLYIGRVYYAVCRLKSWKCMRHVAHG